MYMSSSYTEDYKKIIVQIIRTHMPNAKIILYGSRARHDDKAGSDIDIALDAGAPINERSINNIMHDLEESQLPIYFDIVDFHRVSKEMQQDILREGVVWQK